MAKDKKAVKKETAPKSNNSDLKKLAGCMADLLDPDAQLSAEKRAAIIGKVRRLSK